VETGERLAAYLAGELDADETAALEAELARDPSLRARLEAIRATDAALAALPAVALRQGFSERLRTAVQVELDDQLGGADGTGGAGNDLATRRAHRTAPGTTGTRSWWPQIAVAAAVLAIAGIGLTQLTTGAGDEGGTAAESGGDAGALDAAAAPPAPDAGPTVVAVGRSFDAASLRDLADDERFTEVVAQGLTGADATEAANEFNARIADDDGGSPTSGSDGEETAADAPMSAEAETEEQAGGFGLRTVGEVSPEDLEAVNACLPELVEAARTAVIPVYAELATFDGQDAIVYGLVGNDPAQETYARVELWVVGRGDCQVLHFTQVDR
jgi:hypothetical protein